MKLLLEQGKVVCTLEEKNNYFLNHECWGLFESYEKGKLKLREKDAENTYLDLYHVIESAKFEHVEVSEEVVEYFLKLQKQVYEMRREKQEQAEAKEREKRKQRRWEKLKESGCGACACRAWSEAKECTICTASGDVLKEGWKYSPHFSERIDRYVLMSYIAQPTESCPYNTERRAE